MTRSRFIILSLALCLPLVLAGASAMAQYPGFSDPGAKSAGGGTANGGLVPVLETIDGGKIPVGATAQVVVRFRNDGSQPIQTGAIRLYPSSTISAAIALNQCQDAPLPSGAECAIALAVKGLQSGPWRVEMLMSHSGRTRLVSAIIQGEVEASTDKSDKLSSDIETLPDKVDFGTLDSPQTLTIPVILRNVTSVPIDISDIYIDGSEQAGYSLKTECKKLEAGQSCIAVISWAPKGKGRSSAVLVIKHSGPAALSSVALTGEYTPQNVDQAQVFPQPVPGKGLLVASQTQLDFGGGVATASTITVSLVNAGDAPLSISNIKISGSDNGLSYKEDGCKKGTMLKPIEACPLTVTWSPTRVGGVFDDIQVEHDGARGVLVLPIRGTSIAAVSQDQKAIVLSGVGSSGSSSSSSSSALSKPGSPEPPPPPTAIISGGVSSPSGGAINAASVLDGYKITSFSPTRAIINGPGGSRIVFNNEETVMGGVPWFVVIQKDGIQFLYQGQRILLLFDRSLSSTPASKPATTTPSTVGTGNTSSSSNSTANKSSNNTGGLKF